MEKLFIGRHSFTTNVSLNIDDVAIPKTLKPEKEIEFKKSLPTDPTLFLYEIRIAYDFQILG